MIVDIYHLYYPYNGTDNYSNDRFKLQTENVHDRKNSVESLQKLSAWWKHVNINCTLLCYSIRAYRPRIFTLGRHVLKILAYGLSNLLIYYKQYDKKIEDI